MWLKTISIKNFRTIEYLQLTLEPTANVIVGPNAVGKTTLLEAIRLTKAILAPRTSGEAQQALVSLGAISPHIQQNINYAALARELDRPVEIDAQFALTGDEVLRLDGVVSEIATSIVRANLGPSAQGPLALVQYLSSQNGQTQLIKARQTVEAQLSIIKSNQHLNLKLRIDPNTNTISGDSQIEQFAFAAMEAKLPTNEALFSYFPADRAMPNGEIVIQIGGQDSLAQLESHNSQPQTKFHRLKSTIVNNFILNDKNREKLIGDFRKIFSKVLKDRELVGIQVNQLGLVSVTIKDVNTNRQFEIDGLSSGEKGLLLTLLLISHSVAHGGIIMLDEPELHLNPAICKLILPFIIDELLEPNEIQAIICSHSPEILGTAFENEKCSLLHLQSPTTISKIYKEDKAEIFDALKRLGTSASDVLFSRGSIFVEGEHDIEILRAGFDDVIVRYHLAQLGGRANIESEIKTLQVAEERGELDSVKLFIFDLDAEETNLSSKKFVKVLQWKRRCLENYLINERIIYDLLKEPDVAKTPFQNRGEAASFLKELALSQLDELIASEIYNSRSYENLGLRPKEISNRSISDIASILYRRMENLNSVLNEEIKGDWMPKFVFECTSEKEKRLPVWDSDWIQICDGKKFFRDLHQKRKLLVSPLKFKKLIIEKMRRTHADEWVLVESLLKEGLETN